MVDSKWAAYAWDMKRRQITVHAAGNHAGQWDAYEKIAAALTKALRRCIETFFDGWIIDWANWTNIYTKTSPLAETATNE
jgi:hypothetical protein